MRYSRTGIVAVLLAAEVFIGGAIVWALTGGRTWSVQAAGLNPVSGQGKTYAPIEAGNAPHVIIDDPDSRVVITASTDGKVHLTDASTRHGFFFGSEPQATLTVARTADGVRIARPGDGRVHIGIDLGSERTEVAVPPAAFLDVQRCGGADLAGLTGTVAVHSVDGSISLSGVHSTQVKLASEDGSLRLDDVRSPAIDAVTSDGSIRASNLQVDGGRLQTGDGSIRVALAGVNLTVHAHTADGSISIDGRRIAQDADSGVADYQVGTGGGPLQVSTLDGSIHISTNGAL